MRTLEEVRQFYDSELIGALRAQDRVRTATLLKMLLALAVAGMLCLCGAGATLLAAGEDGLPVAFVAAVIIGVAGLGVCAWLGHGYRSGFKGVIIAKLVAFIDPQLTYQADGCIPRADYDASTIYQHSVDRYAGEDLVSGMAGKTAVQFSELHTQYKTTHTDSKGHRHTQWHTIFRGIFFAADFNKSFSGETVVLTDTAEKMLGGWLGQKLQGMNAARPDLVKLEDPVFEKQFAVYATDQVEARYILTPALMARITAYRQQSGKELQLAFVGGKMYVAISYAKDLFEPRLLRTVVDFAPVAEYYRDLALALGLVGELNLNTRIWSKQ